MAVAQGRYLALDAETVLPQVAPQGEPEWDHFVSVVAPKVAQLQASCNHARRGRVFVAGELVQLLAEAGQCAHAVKLEQLWNQLAKLQSFELYCGYSSACLAADSPHYSEICVEHGRVLTHSKHASEKSRTA